MLCDTSRDGEWWLVTVLLRSTHFPFFTFYEFSLRISHICSTHQNNKELRVPFSHRRVRCANLAFVDFTCRAAVVRLYYGPSHANTHTHLSHIHARAIYVPFAIRNWIIFAVLAKKLILYDVKYEYKWNLNCNFVVWIWNLLECRVCHGPVSCLQPCVCMCVVFAEFCFVLPRITRARHMCHAKHIHIIYNLYENEWRARLELNEPVYAARYVWRAHDGVI